MKGTSTLPRASDTTLAQFVSSCNQQVEISKAALTLTTEARYNISNTVRIGLLSDTHIPEAASELPPQIRKVFRDVDLILHAGDIYTVSVLDELERLAPVIAAEGDDDYHEVINDKRVEKKHILTVEGTIIWLMHERPMFWHQHDRPPDVIVFGHTHRDRVENNEGTLLVNPGSPTFPNYRHKLGTVALLTVNSGKTEVSIEQLE